MNILNLPSPTGGAELGQSAGMGLGLLGRMGYDIYSRNAAMDYLNKALPQTEQIEGTNVQGPQFYNQREREQALRNAPFYLRDQINTLMDQRNQAATFEKNLASEYGDIAENVLNQIYPGASPLTRAKFRNEAVVQQRQGKSPQEVQQYIAQKGKLIGDAGAALQNSVEDLRTQPLTKLGSMIKGEFVPSESLVKTLQQQAKPLIDFGEYDLVRQQLAALNLTPSDIERVLGYKISKDIEDSLIKAGKIETTFDKDLGTYKPNNIEDLKKQIQDVFKTNPSINLVLLRDALIKQEKTDWNTYRDAIADLSNQGVIELSPDQRNQLSVLTRPERNLAQKSLEGVGITVDLLKDFLKKAVQVGKSTALTPELKRKS